jgi:hypothetical protein
VVQYLIIALRKKNLEHHFKQEINNPNLFLPMRGRKKDVSPHDTYDGPYM